MKTKLEDLIYFGYVNHLGTVPKMADLIRYSNPTSHISELARLLNVNIDDSTLHLCIKLIDEGVDPKVLSSSLVRILKETNSVMS